MARLLDADAIVFTILPSRLLRLCRTASQLSRLSDKAQEEKSNCTEHECLLVVTAMT
jgi:hypothetical protein